MKFSIVTMVAAVKWIKYVNWYFVYYTNDGMALGMWRSVL